MPQLSIIISAYNEEENLDIVLPQVIDFCKQNNFLAILINDGSIDNTKEILKKYENNPILSIYHHKVNRGQGGAVKTGILNCKTEYCITIDADGQHVLEDVLALYNKLLESDADMVIGSRMGSKEASVYRGVGKAIIRWVAKMLMPIHVYDINSGMRVTNTEMARKYLNLCPDSFAFCDVIVLVFISQRHLVIEHPIRIKERIGGTSTISTRTAFETVLEILNIVVLFNPLRIFLSLSVFCIVVSVLWGIPYVLMGNGVSVGSVLGIITGLLLFLLGLMAEQLSLLRKRGN